MTATGPEIASAVVALRIKMPGVDKDIATSLGRTDTSKIGQQMGARLTSGLKRSLKVGAVAVGGVLAAGVSTALVKGFSRLNSLDQATAKLRGLGNSAESVDQIMENALASVKGTAFGLDAAATTAAGAVAAGIKPGKELEGVLKSVANSAAATGSGMDEMGSIYNKVASLGKAQNDVLQQVADRGIPIYQALGDQMGVTTDEVFKMATEGKIGFAEFEKAMTTAAGTVADEMGTTVSGSWQNFMASLGRAGAGVLGGVWSSLAPVLQAATNAMGPLEDVAAKVGEKIGDFLAPAIEWLIGALNNGVDFSLFSPLGLIFEAIAPVLPVVSEALGQIASVIGGVLSAVLPTVVPLLVSLATIFGDLLAAILPALVPLFEAIAPVFEVLAGAVLQLLAPILPLISLLVGSLAPILTALSPIFTMLAQALTPVIQLIAGLLTPVIGFLAEALTWVIGIITTAITNAIPWLGQAFTNVWNVIKPVVDWFGQAFAWLWETILQPVFNAVKVGFAILGGIIQGVWEAIIKPAIDALAAIFTWLWENVIRPIVNFIVAYVKVLGAIYTWLWQNAIKPAIDGIATVFRWLWDNVIKPVWDGISNTIKGVWENGIKPIIDTLVRVIQSDPKKAFEAARDAIGDAWAGIQELAKKPVHFVVDTVINGLIDTINMIPGVDLPKVELPPGFSEGGYTGNVGRSAVAGVVHGDEHVIRARSRRRIEASHPGLLDHMNRYGRIPGYRVGGLVNPLPRGSYTVSQPYHAGHNGIDLAAATGTKVYAAAAGTVGLAGSVNMGGNEVYIQHGNGLGTRYSHLSRFATKAGASVKAGNVIGYVGSTGMSTGPHLHYMVHNPGGGAGSYGNHVNPAPYLGLFGKDLGEAGGAGGGLFDGLIDGVADQIKKAFPDGGMWIDVASGIAKDAAKRAVDIFSPKLGTDVGATLYDDGGWLQPGRHLVENRSGRPEPILTGSQWDSLVESRGSDGERVLHLYDVDGVLMGTMRAVAEDAVDDGFEDQDAAGRRYVRG